MKKMLALLLALCMLLPTAALADAVTYRTTMHMDKDAYRTVLTDVLEQEIGDSADMDEMIGVISDVICGIMDVTTVEFTVQDNGFAAAVLLQDAQLVNFAVTVEENELLISTSLMEDYVFAFDLTETAETVAAVDWDALLEAMGSTVRDWYRTREITYDASGNYVGAAYEGGNERYVVTLDDMDIALLVEGLLLDVEQSDLMPVLTESFGAENVAEALRDIRAFNFDAALLNNYDYEISFIYRTEGLVSTPIGFSLNVGKGGEEAWSLSSGGEGEDFRFIGAFHVDGMTNYFAFTQDVETVSSTEEATTSVFAIYQAEQGATYAEASADPMKALMYYEYTAAVTTVGTAAHYRRTTLGTARSIMEGKVFLDVRNEMAEEYAASPYAYSQEGASYVGDSETPMATTKTNAAAGEPFAHPADAKRITPDDFEDGAVQDELSAAVEAGIAQMGVVAMQNIPAGLLLELMQMMQ